MIKRIYNWFMGRDKEQTLLDRAHYYRMTARRTKKYYLWMDDYGKR